MMKYVAGPKCKAKCKSTQERCKRYASIGQYVCHVHGGATPRGLADRKTKTGRYSADLPTQLAYMYRQALSNPELVSVKDEIAITETRLRELLQLLKPNDSNDMWAEVGGQVDRLRNLRQAEHKRLVDLQQMISTDRAILLLGAVVDIVMNALKKHVDNERVVRVVYADISKGFTRHLSSIDAGKPAVSPAS